MAIKDTSIGGIILAGGKSSRMGTDKGLIDFWGKKLISYAIDLLSPYCAEILISTNQPGYDKIGYNLVADEYSGCGPIGGLHAALSESSYEWNLVVSCDTPYLHPSLVEEMIKEKEGYEIVIPIHEDGVEPLVALYHKSMAEFFEEKILKKEFKLQDIVKERNVNYWDVDFLLFKYPLLFQNFNSPRDFVG